MMLADLQAKAASAQDVLRTSDPHSATHLAQYLKAYEDCPHGVRYQTLPPQVASMVDMVRGRGGEELLAMFHRAALLRGLVDIWQELPSHRVWPHSAPFFQDSAKRIADYIAEVSDDRLTHSNDVFAKSIALATGRLWHAKAQVVEPRMGISRKALISPNPLRLAKAIAAWVRLGGGKYFYEIHTYDLLLHWFNPDGWADCYRVLAESLSRDTAARGVMGSSWFFDPQLATVSPRLHYLHEFPRTRGAWFFHVGSTPQDVRLATLTSETRRRLYEAGEYVPQQYLMIWTRASMLDWWRRGAE
jgi:hypothetical protein